jgi:nitrogen fixation protein NifU and related proteins
MSDDLYQQAIMERAKSRAGAGRLEKPSASATVDNPLCGDRVTLDVTLNNGSIAAVGHQVRGCALCQASAAVIATASVGQTPVAALAGRDTLKAVLTGGVPAAPWAELGIFAPVQRHKSRHDCVLLPFEALAQALGQAAKT